MFVFSIKTSKRQLVRLTGGMVMVAVALLMTLFLPQGSVPTTAKGHTQDERIQYLYSLGYEVDLEEIGVREICIPDEFDDVFMAYNELQKQAGMDLAAYRNKRVKRYTYQVTNYPGRPQVQAHVLVYKGKIIGGDLTDTADSGYMTGLVARPVD